MPSVWISECCTTSGGRGVAGSALVEIGRQHARNFDAGHAPSGSGVQRVLTELRKLAAEHEASPVAS